MASDKNKDGAFDFAAEIFKNQMETRRSKRKEESENKDKTPPNPQVQTPGEGVVEVGTAGPPKTLKRDREPNLGDKNPSQGQTAKKAKYATSESVEQLSQLVLNMDKQFKDLAQKLTSASKGKSSKKFPAKGKSTPPMSDSEEENLLDNDSEEEAMELSEEEIDKLLNHKTEKGLKPDKPVEQGADSDLEEILDEFAKDEEVGPPISEQLAKVLKNVISKDTNDPKVEKLLEQYTKPVNLVEVQTPKVNGEIWGKLHLNTRSKDIKLQKAQKRLSAGICAITYALDKLVALKVGTPELKEPVRQIIDGVMLLASANAETNFRRKEFIKPDLNSRFQNLVKIPTPGSNFLFGDDLSKSVKDLTETNKVGYDISQNAKPRYQQQHKGKSNWYNSGKNYSGQNKKPVFHKGQNPKHRPKHNPKWRK